MKRLFLIALCLSTPAFAQEGLPPECRIIEEYGAVSGGADYQPGIDIHGKPVVPADINATPMGVGREETVVIPLSIDMVERMRRQSIPGLEMTSTLGFIEVGPGGRVTYNGQDLTNQVHVLCDEPPAPPADGQGARDPVEYAPVKQKPKGAPAPKPVTSRYPQVETPVLSAPAAKPEPKRESAQGALIEGGEYR